MSRRRARVIKLTCSTRSVHSLSSIVAAAAAAFYQPPPKQIALARPLLGLLSLRDASTIHH